MKIEDFIDLIRVIKACKTEEEAKRAGILMSEDEMKRERNRIAWADQPVRVRKESDLIGTHIGADFSLPGKLTPGNKWEPLPCCMCNEQIQVGEEYRYKSFYIVHENCLKK